MSNNTASTVTDEQLFNNYRATLKSIRAKYKGDTRTGSRKQQALKKTADRYGKPISYVKSVVKRIEAERGITHEHTQNYLDELHHNTTAQRYEENIRIAQKESGISDGIVLACELCGSMLKEALIRVRSPQPTDRDQNNLPIYQFAATCFISYFNRNKNNEILTVEGSESCEQAYQRIQEIEINELPVLHPEMISAIYKTLNN